MSDVVVSILIPTYNRAPYLFCLLTDLAENISALKHTYEIVISDNASTDRTESVVQEFLGKLNIRYIKRDKNYGGYDNWLQLKWLAEGVFQISLADDDGLILSELSSMIDKMLADPGIGIVHSPLIEHDRVSGDHQVYWPIENDFLIKKNEHVSLLDFILDRYLLAETFVVRSDLAKLVSPITNKHAYWSFVQAAEYLSYADVLFVSKPFYILINRYFADEPARKRMGELDIQELWDGYRGGLEYILARAHPSRLDPGKYAALQMKIHKFSSLMLSGGVAARINNKRDPVDTYYLICRIKSMSHLSIFKHFDAIRHQAIVHYVLNDIVYDKAFDKLIFIGAVDDALLNLFLAKSHVPLYRDGSFRPDRYENAIVLLEGSVLGLAVDQDLIEAKSLSLAGISDLLQKFS